MCPHPRASAWPPRPGPSSQSQRNTPLPPPFPAALAAPPRPTLQLLFTSPPRLLGPFCTVICPGETQLRSGAVRNAPYHKPDSTQQGGKGKQIGLNREPHHHQQRSSKVCGPRPSAGSKL